MCILSGGAAPYIAPALKCRYQLVDNIVLVGLHAVARAGTSMEDGTC
jgi:type III pantothenate kinase